MALTSFAAYEALRKQNHKPPQMGFAPACRSRDITLFENRVRLARSFRGLVLDGYAPETVTGYNAFFQVFLTHSALECFLQTIGLKYPSQLEPMLLPHHPGPVVAAFFACDPKSLLYDFLYARVDSRYLQPGLEALKSGTSQNVACLSAAIRHIFAHGQLTAHASGIRPKRVHRFCVTLSDFLLGFMDAEFTAIVDCYTQSIQAASPFS